jgi:carbon-monoxide dehydrogenase large subunit
MNVIAPKFGMGASPRRLEDDAFIRGQGRYTDDIAPVGVLHGYVLRSPVARGTFAISSTAQALAAPGVHLVLTASDIEHLGDITTGGMQKQPDGTRAIARDIPVLCRDRVNYVGDAVAFIVADTRAQAQDASELIEIEYVPEDAVARTADSQEIAFAYQLGEPSSSDAAFDQASHVTRIAFHNNRLVCNYMEPRAAIGEWSEKEDRYTLTTGSQGVHSVRRIIAETVFGIPQEKLRVITPDVGGGFGPKVFVYREYPLVLEAARRLGRPVKWTCDRTEHFLTDAQGRDNLVEAEMAMDGNGRFLALRVRNRANMGAYAHQFGPAIPWIGSSMSTGVYDIPALDVSITGVYTNTCPVDAYRGAGRPEAAFLIEKLVDACARDLGHAPDEIRRRNFIRPEQFPYRTPTGRVYDVGEFEGHMDLAMQRADWTGFPARAGAAAAAGKIRGIGMATYIEACAFAGSEPVHALLNDDGTITLLIGTQSNGQGHATAYAQLAAEKLNVDIDRIKLHQGDTDRLDKGGGTGGSRSIPLGGVSASRAGEDLANKIRKIAADEMEAAEADIELADGWARIVGTDRVMDFAEIAKAARSPDDKKGFGEFVQEEATYPNGTHICEVEIDPETGKTQIVNYVIVDDFGATVNPLLLAGQVHGGVVQGLGQALTEDAVYAEDGQMLTATFMDYAMPRADDVPSFHFETRNVPSTTNAMGIKGAGEAGTIGSSPALINAITDALHRAYGIGHIEMPATPHRIWQAIAQAASSR